MIVYVKQEGRGEYRVFLRKPGGQPGDIKEFDVPQSAAYLLLSAQAGHDALQDSLEAMWLRGESSQLHWSDDGKGPGGGG